MKEKIKVSVIIPTYNGEQTIERAIKSILSQTLDCEKEILICDDYSTDNTVYIANQYPCVKVLSSNYNSGGPNKGRNRGIKAATGNYVAFLDQDDYWLPEKLEVQVLEDADVVYSQVVGTKQKPVVDTIYNTLLKRSKKQGWAYLGSLLIRNNNIPLFEECFGQLDYGWMLQLTKNRLCIECQPVVVRSVGDNNLSRNPEYRKRDFYMGLMEIDPDVQTMKRWYASRARYHYVMFEMRMARFYFIRGEVNLKTILYFISSYNKPLSRWIIKQFKVSG
jgi:glycosyltransferase involved in cell wall biosynthesis